MLADINDVFKFFTFLVNKYQSGSISGDEFNLAINVAQQQYFRTKLGLPEMYTVEKREAPQELQVTQVIDDSMRQFIKSVPLQQTGLGFTLPTDLAALMPNGYMYVYQAPDGSTQTSQQPIDFVTIGEALYRQNNYVTAPSLTYPIATYLNGQLVVSPPSITTIQLIYYRYPVTPVFGFTVVNDEIIYNPATSVQLEFPNLDWENICHIAVKYYAQFLREEFIYQTEEKRIATGM